MNAIPALSMRSLCSAVGVALLVSAPLFGQPRGAGPRYDASTEATVSGTVESIEQVTGRGGGGGRRGPGGTHLQLKTSAETLDVRLGPSAFLSEQKIAIAKGDTLEVVGSRVTIDGKPALIAKSVKKGDQVWTLRDSAGLPLWRGGRGGRR